jgi:hypothetical protein
MRHQSTAYDQLKIRGIKGRRRELWRELAEVSRELLARNRRADVHGAGGCPLCRVSVSTTLPTCASVFSSRCASAATCSGS